MKKNSKQSSQFRIFWFVGAGLGPAVVMACSGGTTGAPGGATSGSANAGTNGTVAGSAGNVGASGTAAGGAMSSAGGNHNGGTNSGGTSSGGTSSGGSSGGGASSVAGGGSGTMMGGSAGTNGNGGSTAGGGSTCPGTLKAGDSNQTIMSGGLSRKFIVHLPTGYKGDAPLPVILDFHPLGGTGASQEKASGWGTKCDSVGCIAVFPDSGPSDNSWNVGYCCSNSQKQKVDDVQFARDMIKWLQANTCIDSKRVYASGCSNGGGMSYMLACNAADVIAAVAPVDFRCITGAEPANASSLTPENNTACTCKLPRPISVLAFDEGQDMSIVPYNGGKTAVSANCPPNSSCAAFNFPGAEVNFQTWAHFDMCTGAASADAKNSICQKYTSCGGNTEVGLCTVPSANHCGSYGLAKIVDTAWDMFAKQALP